MDEKYVLMLQPLSDRPYEMNVTDDVSIDDIVQWLELRVGFVREQIKLTSVKTRNTSIDDTSLTLGQLIHENLIDRKYPVLFVTMKIHGKGYPTRLGG